MAVYYNSVGDSGYYGGYTDYTASLISEGIIDGSAVFNPQPLPKEYQEGDLYYGGSSPGDGWTYKEDYNYSYNAGPNSGNKPQTTKVWTYTGPTEATPAPEAPAAATPAPAPAASQYSGPGLTIYQPPSSVSTIAPAESTARAAGTDVKGTSALTIGRSKSAKNDMTIKPRSLGASGLNIGR
jgi:hypothetical protein